jgi:cholesterol 7-dehydrogenase
VLALFGIIHSLPLSTTNMIIIIMAIILYILYYKYYSFYIFRQKKSFTKGKHLIGKTPPCYPNGWFCIGKSTDLKISETKYIDHHGENIAIFRGTNGKLYALDAYCAHMGANLGVDGQVTNEHCVRCPFHGWVFDGETGNCVVGSKQKEGISFEYVEKDGKCSFQEKFDHQKHEKISIKKYNVLERCGFMFAWFDASGKEPSYEPLDITEYTKRLSYRGISINVVHSHVQDIAENGGDIMHFLYIHHTIIPKLVKGFWKAQWIRGDDPELIQKMTHPNKNFNEYRMKLLNKYLTEENKSHIGVIDLDNQISILGSTNLHFFCLTGFQVGPGLVYLFLKSNFFETVLFQHVDSVKKYEHHVYHHIYCCNWNPYWFSALQLRLEAQQVLNDGVIWDNKKFGLNPMYCLTSEADLTLIAWRKWFTQFYDGCKLAEAKKENLEW